MLDNYRFTGFINLFNIYPDFLFPVYEKDNELYFHNGEINSINDFDPLNESSKNKVTYLDDSRYHIICSLDSYYYTKHSSPAYAFQESENVVFCSGLNTMYNFMKNYRTDDKILNKTIKNFIDECLTAMNDSEPGENTYVTNLSDDLKVMLDWFSSYRALRKKILHETESERHDIIYPLMFPSYHNVQAHVPSFYFEDTARDNFMSNVIYHYALPHPSAEYMHHDIMIDLFNSNEFVAWKHIYESHNVCSFLLSESKAPDSSCTPYDISIKELTSLQKSGAFVVKPIYELFTPAAYYPFANKLPKTITDFSKLKLSFDRIIKCLSPMSDFYEICIKCQNFVINMDEDHLLQTIYHHLRKFEAMNLNKLLDDYLIQYIQSHIIETNYIYIDEIKNNKD